MKIGLLTVPFNNNYGGLLQAYALKTVLERKGHEIIIINRQRNPIKGFKHRVYRLLVRLHLIEDFLANNISRISENTNRFKTKYLSPITAPFYSSTEMKSCLRLGIDFYVVGSDQVWRYKYAGDSIDDFFFGFVDAGDNVPRISYAASFGIDQMDYPEDKKNRVASLLRNFRAISVREESGKRLLSEYLGVSSSRVRVVLDPTLLLGQEDYLKLFNDYPRRTRHFLFTYILDQEMTFSDFVDSFTERNQLDWIDIKAQTKRLNKGEIIEPVETWLSSIYYSDYVLTDSFHGTVFSIIFHKQFVVLANPRRGVARLRSLLSSLGLQDRLIQNDRSDISVVLTSPIDWIEVERRLSGFREDSLLFLSDALACSK